MHRRAFVTGAAALTTAAALDPFGGGPALGRAEGASERLTAVQVLGDPAAPVTVIEYASLTCPHCARFHSEVYPELKSAYIDTGKAKLEFREVYFDRFGLWGAMLARCGGEARYFGFIELLLTRQDAWAKAADPAQALFLMGRQGGLTDEEMTACMGDQDFMRSLVEQYKGFMEDPRLSGTPTLIVQDEKIANPTFENLSEAIDDALGS